MAKSYRNKSRALPQSRTPPHSSHCREPSFSTDSQAVFEVQSLPVRTIPLERLFTGSSLSTSFVVSPRPKIVETAGRDLEEVLVSSDFGGNRALQTAKVSIPKREEGLVRVRVLAQDKRRKAESTAQGKDLGKQLAISRIYGGGRSSSFSQPGKRLIGTAGLGRQGRNGVWIEGVAGRTMLPRVRLPVSRSPLPYRLNSRSAQRQKSASPQSFS